MDISKLKNGKDALAEWLGRSRLRHHQMEAVTAVVEELRKGTRKIVIEMAAGTGKRYSLLNLGQFLIAGGVVEKILFLFEGAAIAEQMRKLLDSERFGNNRSGRMVTATYADLQKNQACLLNFELVICMEPQSVKSAPILNLLNRALEKGVYFIGVVDSAQRSGKSFFSGVASSYAYSVDDTLFFNERSFVNGFINKLLIRMGFQNLSLNPVLQFAPGLCPDLMAFDAKSNPLLVLEAKVYRSRHVSQHLLDQALFQLQSYRQSIKAELFVLVLLCEVSEAYKQNAYREHGVHIWDLSNLLFLCENDVELTGLLASHVSYPIQDLRPQAVSGWESSPVQQPGVEDGALETAMDEARGSGLIRELLECRPGRSKKMSLIYESICERIVKFLFIQDFTRFSTQHKTGDKLFRMDALAGLKGGAAFWDLLIRHYNTKFVVFEFKNLGAAIPQNLVYITEKYLFSAALRNVALIISRKGFHVNAREAVLGCLKEHGKLIMEVTDEDLIKMIRMKEAGTEPSDHLLEKLEGLLMGVSK